MALPTSKWTFLTLKVDKNNHFWPPTHLVHIVIERPTVLEFHGIADHFINKKRANNIKLDTKFTIQAVLLLLYHFSNVVLPAFFVCLCVKSSRGIFCSSSLQLLELVFCFQNCSDLLWEKNCPSNGEKLLKFKAECQEFATFLRSHEQSIQTAWKVKTVFGNRMLF